MRRKLAGQSIRVQLATAFLGLTVLISAGLLPVAGWGAHHYLREQLRRRLMDVASVGAVMVDGDLLAPLKTRSDESGPSYQQVKRKLQALRDATPGIRYVYTMRPVAGSKQWTFIVDAEEDPKLVSHIGDQYDISDSPEMVTGLKGPAADRELVRDRWGWWLSGYAPVKDGQGRTAALLGLDMSAAEVLRQEREVLRIIVLVLAMCLAASSLLSRWLARAFSRPIMDLAEATRAVAQGDLTVEVNTGGSRELAMLGGSFNQMTRAVRAGRDRMVGLSNTDFLTGLPNHRYFQERFDQEVKRAARYQRPLSLVMLDLDHFRQVNGEHGHQGGDEVLRQVAVLLKDALRESDVATRYGGEEFAVIMSETTAAEAYESAERIRGLVEEHPFVVESHGTAALQTAGPSGTLQGPLGVPKGGQAEVRLTVSGGVAGFPGDSSDRNGLLVAVDVALLRAKGTHRNRIQRYSEDDGWPGLTLDLADLHRALQDASVSAVAALSQALDARDHYTQGHSENVTRIALQVAKAMGMPRDMQATLQVAGLLHDIGKIGVPDQVLRKPGKLTSDEWALIRSHPSMGGAILAKAPLLAEVIPIVLGHHERYDGKGYPKGTSGQEIPLPARILAVADTYDAMTSDRPYRPAMTKEQALFELRANAGIQFDPEVVAAFESIAPGVDKLEPVPV